MRHFHDRIAEIELRIDLYMLEVIRIKFENESIENQQIQIFCDLLKSSVQLDQSEKFRLKEKVALFLNELFKTHSSTIFNENYRQHLVTRELFDDFSDPEKFAEIQKYFSQLERRFFELDTQHKKIKSVLSNKSNNVFFSQEKSDDLQRKMDSVLKDAEAGLEKQIESGIIVFEPYDISPHSLRSFLKECQFDLSEIDDSFSFSFVSPKQNPCKLELMNIAIGNIAGEVLHLNLDKPKGKNGILSEKWFVGNIEYLFKKNSKHWHIEVLSGLRRRLFPTGNEKGSNKIFHKIGYKPSYDPAISPYSHQLAHRICLLAGADASILNKDNLEMTLKTVIRDYYNIEMFNEPYLVAIKSFLDAEDLIQKMEFQVRQLLRLKDAATDAVENAKKQLEIFQEKELRYLKIRQMVAANNKALACIDRINKLQQEFDDYYHQVSLSSSEMPHLSFSPKAYFVLTDLPFSEKICLQLEEKQALFQELTLKIEKLNHQIDEHNAAVRTLAKISEEHRELEKHHYRLTHLSNGSEGIPREELLQAIEALESAMSETGIKRDVSNTPILNQNLANSLCDAQSKLCEKHKRSDEIMQFFLKAIDSAIHDRVTKKIEYLKNQIASINCVMEKRSFNRNQVVQKDLQEIQEILSNACQKYQTIIERSETHSQAMNNKIAELTQQDEKIKNFLQQKYTLYQNSRYAASVGRIFYEEVWGLAKRIVLTILRRYAEMEHLPRRIKTKTLLQETTHCISSSEQRLPEIFDCRRVTSGCSENVQYEPTQLYAVA